MSAGRVRDISEFDLIRRLRDVLPEAARTSAAVVLPIGDDAAAAAVSSGELIVVTTDTLNDGIHFRLDWTGWEDLGHKALAVNLSDLAAMGATPILATVSLALTGDEAIADLEVMYRGMGRCAATFKCVIAGGDITHTPGPLSISVTAIGETTNGRLLRRDTAVAGDQIWVTGAIGAAAAGLALEQLPESDQRRTAATAPVLIEALHRPTPRIGAGQALARVGVRCAMDLSDGLAGDLRKILDASGVDAEIELGAVPVPAAVRALFREAALPLALHGGDDYELLFTAPVGLSAHVSKSLQGLGLTATAIGRITERRGPESTIVAVGENGSRSPVDPRGYDHFLPRQVSG